MSSSIWTRCAGSSEIAPVAADAVRVVEAQHVVGTRRLVDSAAEHERLEELIERVKPREVKSGRSAAMHYLLRTPFRYPPLRHGSRFATRRERGVFYGALAMRTAMAEVAYYRLVFLEGTRAVLPPLPVELTSFRARIETDAGIDLTRAPFDAFEREISSPLTYDASQSLGHAMRTAGVLAFFYRSARDTAHGTALGVFAPEAIASSRPKNLETWMCIASRAGVEVTRKDFFKQETLWFPREDFLVQGALPAPAV